MFRRILLSVAALAALTFVGASSAEAGHGHHCGHQSSYYRGGYGYGGYGHYPAYRGSYYGGPGYYGGGSGMSYYSGRGYGGRSYSGIGISIGF